MKRILKFMQMPEAWLPLFTWPMFSLTSFCMISNLYKQGVVPRTVIDVGANVGQFAVAAVKLFPDVVVYSFEPNPACVKTLRKHVNPLGKVFVYPTAVGEEENEVDFHINSHSHSSSILPLTERHLSSFPNAYEVSITRVQVSSLDTVFSGVNLEGPVLLKLDVQGYEAQVLRGATKTLNRIDYVVLEASFRRLYQGEMLFIDIVHLMENYGFSFLRPVGWLADPLTEEIIQMDALFSSSTATVR